MKHCCLGLSMLHLIILLANVTWSNSLQPSVSSVQFSGSVVSDSSRPYELQHTSPPYPSPTPGVYSNSCPSSQWCHPAISSSVVPSSSCPQSLQASGSFPMSQLFVWGGQITGVSASASVLPMNTQIIIVYCKWSNYTMESLDLFRYGLEEQKKKKRYRITHHGFPWRTLTGGWNIGE